MRLARFGAPLAAAFILAIAVGPARAAAMGVDPNQILTIAREFSKAELELDGAGDPMIRGMIDADVYLIYFYGCTDGQGCTNMTFSATWVSDHYTDRSMGDWNRSHRVGKAFLNADGDPTLEMSINLYGGASRFGLRDSFDWWRLLVQEFKGYFGL